MKSVCSVLAVTVILAGGTAVAEKNAKSIHDFEVKSLEGEQVDLEKYKGKVLLVVNVASRWGATPQYEQLQAIYEQHKDDGLVVLGFPCNQFGGQEPGSADEIREFCTSKYSVRFPMFSKIDVNGDEAAPLYEWLKKNADNKADIGWNFEKFVVSRDGNVVARFRTPVKPDDQKVLNVIEEELAKQD